MYITARGRVEEIIDVSYTRSIKKDGKKVEETVQKFRLSLTIPGMQDQMSFDMAAEVAPDTKTADRWEMDEAWVVVTADSMRLSKGETDGRAWALVSFNATKVEEMTQPQRQELVQARRVSKQDKKQKAADRKAAKKATKKTDVAA